MPFAKLGGSPDIEEEAFFRGLLQGLGRKGRALFDGTCHKLLSLLLYNYTTI